MTLQSILDEMVHQLDWRGPSGKSMGHIVLGRSEAQALVKAVCELQLKQNAVAIETAENPYGPGDPAEIDGT